MNTENYFTYATDDVCVTIQKSFAAPITAYYKKLIELDNQGEFSFDIQANLKFYLRFYFPKEQITTPGARPNRFIIMFNGLNETFARHFYLYDRLGISFAAKGITAVLLPTPFHLNRAAICKESLKKYNGRNNVPQTAEHFKIPSNELINNPFNMYMNFIQTLHEYRILRNLLAGEFEKVVSNDAYGIDSPNEDERDFYRRHVNSESMEISILGYSLGGLKALTCFSYDPETVKSCVLLNAGATLDKMMLKGIMDDKKWKKAVTRLKDEQDLGINPLIKMLIREDQLYPHVRKVFFSSNLFTPETIERVGKKLILIIGGRDKIIPPESIKRLEPEGYGLNILQISELGHFLYGDVIFNRWYPRIIRILCDFFQEPKNLALSKREAMRILMVYHVACDSCLFPLDDEHVSKSFLELRETVTRKLKTQFDRKTVQKLLKHFDEVYRIVSSYIDPQNDLWNQMKQLRRKTGLLFGDVLISEFEYLKEEKDKIEKSISDIPKTKKIGKVFLKAKLIDEKQLNHILKKQLTRYKSLIEDSSMGKEWLAPLFNGTISSKNHLGVQKSQPQNGNNA